MVNLETLFSADVNIEESEPEKDKPLIIDIIVPFAGTVDPGNSDEVKKAKSYSSKKSWTHVIDSNWYWKENIEFRNGLRDFKNKYKKDNENAGVELWDKHGWSGDNSVHNRKVAGAYIADRLCGRSSKNTESYNDYDGAVFPRYFKKEKYPEVNFHLIGHSHGGNVINEFTKRVATIPEWPDHWKIKSITYLSTPFFKKLHKPDTSKFHPDAKIINVFNKYDLTQRAIADFSLKQLPGLSGIMVGNSFEKHIETISAHWEIIWPLLKELNLSDEEGRILYDACLGLLDTANELLDDAKKIIGKLNEEYEYRVDNALKGKVTHKRRIISIGLKERFVKALEELQEQVVDTHIASFRERRAIDDGYSRMKFYKDLNFIDPIEVLIKWFRISPASLESVFFDLVHDAIAEQLDEYDNTRNTPDDLYTGVPVVPVDVTEHDYYYQQRDEQFDEFIKFLEEKEDNYESNRTKRNLLDIFFTLLAQIPAVRTTGCGVFRQVAGWLNFLLSLDEDDIDDKWYDLGGDDWKLDIFNTGERENIINLIALCRDYRRILASRNGGFCCEIDEDADDADECTERADNEGIEITTDKDDGIYHPNRGGLGYLMIISHSVSRARWYEKVEKNLHGIINKPLK